MSGWVSGWVLRHATEMTPARKMVLIALADEANDDGVSCHPSVRRVAAMANIGVGTARAHLLALETEGWIIIDRPEKSGRGHYNRYGILMDNDPVDIAAMIDEERGRKSTPSANKGSKNARKGSKNARPMARAYPDPNPDPKKQVNPQAGYPQAFEDLWSAYPPRAGGNSKKAAHRAWRARVREGASEEDLLAAVKAYARSRVGQDPAYTKMASTYLGPDEHWQADLEAAHLTADPGPGHTPPDIPCRSCGGSTWVYAGNTLEPCRVCDGTGRSTALPPMPPTETEPF